MTTEEKTVYDLGYFEGQEIMKLALANLQNQVRELRKNREQEICQLEVAIYDGKKEAGVLRKMLAETHEVNAELHKEIAELHKDKERLDWLLDEESGVNVEYVYTDKRGKYIITWFDDREDIDKAMEEHFATER